MPAAAVVVVVALHVVRGGPKEVLGAPLGSQVWMVAGVLGHLQGLDVH